MSKRILIVDDSESIRELVGHTLETAGYEVEKAVDGHDAMTRVNKSLSLVITDLNMPNMDGVQFIREIRRTADFAYIPILLLTTESQASKKEEARNAGATGWIVKPFAQEKLLEVVKKVIR